MMRRMNEHRTRRSGAPHDSGHGAGADPRTAAPPTLTALTAYLMSRTGRTARAAIAAELAAVGLRLWHMAALAALADFGPQAQRDLSARLAVDPSDMVRVVDELAAPGYVERTRDLADRRRVRVTLTPAGRVALASLRARAVAVQDAVLAPLDARERALLHDLLAKVYDAARLRDPVRPAVKHPVRPAAGRPSPP